MRKKNWIEFKHEEKQSKIEGLEVKSNLNKSGVIKIRKEKKGKKGKLITIISGFSFNESFEYKKLLKNLKTFCGTGGTLNDNCIHLQGDMEDKVKDFLGKDGFHI